MLLSGFVVAATPTSAALSWGSEDLPGAKSNVLATVNITDMAVATGGEIIYAATGTATMYRSSNGGESWSAVTAEAGRIDLVAVAPDDENWIAVADNNTDTVYISDDAGASWDTLPAASDDGKAGTLGTLTVAFINDLAVSAMRSSTHYVAAAGTDNASKPNIFVYNVGASVPAWDEKGSRTGFQSYTAGGEVQAVAFSPNYASDKVMVAVSSAAGAGVYFQIYSYDNNLWNDNAAFTDEYPVTLTSEAVDEIMSASIAMAPDYLGSDDALRLAFVGLSVNGTNAALEDSGVYRLEDDSMKFIRENRQIHSLDYDGTNIVAGRFNGTSVYRCDDPLASSPTFRTSATLKSPSGANQVQVAFLGGDDVGAVTFGDESAFSISRDLGKSFNSISLIDTGLDVLTDVAVSSDGSQLYLVSYSEEGTTGTADDDLSVWRQASSWERVLSVTGVRNYIVRTAPEDPDVVYLAAKGATTMYYSASGGVDRWQSRVCKVNVQDFAVESADVIIAMDNGGSVSKSTNSGFTWGGTKSNKLGNGHTIISVGEDKVICGGTTGYVSYSTDGASTFTKLDDDGGTLMQVAANGLEDGDQIWAASNDAGSAIMSWEIGSDDEWDTIDDDNVQATQGVYGMAYKGGILYVVTANTEDSKSMRTMNPTSSSATWRTKDSDGESFTAAPSALRLSIGDDFQKLWALAVDDDKLMRYTDSLTTLVPTLKAPATGTTIGINAVTGKADTLTFVWESPSDDVTQFDIAVAVDEGFDEPVIDDENKTKASGWDEGDTVSQLIGPEATAPFQVVWNPGQTYYWRVRVDSADTRSGWSEVRSFTVEDEPQPQPPVQIEIPPTPQVTLPAPEVTVEVPPPTKVEIPPAPPAPAAPAPITPAYIWATIIIGAILIIALIILIVRTRRVS
jgi:hypothetical protein